VYSLLVPSYNVFLAADGGEGLACAKRHRPDLIVTDFMMPHVSGREFLQAIRTDSELSRTPVIFLTARAGTGARIESLEAGADDYLTKPFDQGELLARVRNMLTARAQERELETLNQRLEAQIHEQMAELVRAGTLKRFLPEPIVRNLLAGVLTSEKPFERRKITSLSIGIGNFPAVTETLEAEDLAVVVNDFIREITAIGMQRGGTVDKIVADTVHVIFGAPEEMPVADQARAAIESARQAQRVQSRIVPGELAVQAGINTGYCTVGVFGSELLSSYSAIGEPVNIAHRLRAAAASGSILLGAQTYALLQGELDATGPKTLTGSLHPIAYYEIAGAAQQSSRTKATTSVKLGPGGTLAHFKVVSAIGSGGMGEVFLAEDQRLHRLVALKVAPPEVTNDEIRKERFLLEARSASALNHANIAHIYDIGEDRGVSYIAMEYIDGTTLRTKIGGNALTNDELITIALQIGCALEEAHRKGVVHRDIKPENIMLTPRGELKVLDFGLAKVAWHDAGGVDTDARTHKMITSPGTVLGTVHYMSPEQALGRDIDFRSDIFSLGVVMYEIATGRLPFSAATATETIDLIVHAEPLAVNRFNYTVPPEVEYVIRKCLQKNPANRYQSTSELVIDLRNLQRAAVV
jgi:class 3 adenylate cyclase/predicted Ser/Thr protein kinase